MFDMIWFELIFDHIENASVTVPVTNGMVTFAIGTLIEYFSTGILIDINWMEITLLHVK